MKGAFVPDGIKGDHFVKRGVETNKASNSSMDLAMTLSGGGVRGRRRRRSNDLSEAQLSTVKVRSELGRIKQLHSSASDSDEQRSISGVGDEMAGEDRVVTSHCTSDRGVEGVNG